MISVPLIDKDKSKKPSSSPASKVKEERRKDDVRRQANSGSSRQPPRREAGAEEISEFFGEAKKSSVRQLHVDALVGDSEDDSEFEGAKEGRQSDSDESEGMEAVMRDTEKDAEFTLEEFIQKRLRYMYLYPCSNIACLITISVI